MTDARQPTISELIAEGIQHAHESGMTMRINQAKVIQLHLYESGYSIIPIASKPQYMASCLRAGACTSVCESTACTNYGNAIVVRRCVESKRDGVVYPEVDK